MMIVVNTPEQSRPYTLLVNETKGCGSEHHVDHRGESQVRIALITVRLQNTSTDHTSLGVTVLTLVVWHHGNTVGGTQEPC